MCSKPAQHFSLEKFGINVMLWSNRVLHHDGVWMRKVVKNYDTVPHNVNQAVEDEGQEQVDMQPDSMLLSQRPKTGLAA